MEAVAVRCRCFCLRAFGERWPASSLMLVTNMFKAGAVCQLFRKSVMFLIEKQARPRQCHRVDLLWLPVPCIEE